MKIKLTLFIIVILLSQCLFSYSKLSKKKAARNSFLQVKEVDDIDDDDSEDSNREISKLKQENKNVLFTELKTKNLSEKSNETALKNVNSNKLGSANETKSDKPKGKLIDKIKYFRRKKKKSDSVRMKLFRIGKMNEIQKGKRWRHSRAEGNKGRFSKIIAAQGNKNADEFVSFLGFLRDSTYKGSQNIFRSDLERFFK
jgi:hypothetical protein